MDVRHPLTPHDRAMLELARAAALPVHVLLTKADKLGRGAARAGACGVRATSRVRPPCSSFRRMSGEGLARGARERWMRC